MKTFLFALVAGCIPALITTNGAYAQTGINTNVLNPQNDIAAIEKVVKPINDHTVEMPVVSARAVKDFAKAYKNVKGETWEKIKDGFAVRFYLNGRKSLVYYDRKGRWVGSLKGYFENQLPKEIRRMVLSEYFDYAITYVQEVETIESHGVPTYVIHLEGEYNLKQVRVTDGQMETWKEFEKQQK